jgi:hypothetical protein
VLPVEGIPEPRRAAAFGAQFMQNTLTRPDFQARVAEDVGFLAESEVAERVRFTARPVGSGWEFRFTATGRSAHQAQELARGFSAALRGLRGIHRTVLTALERRRLRDELQTGDLEGTGRARLRQQLRELSRDPPEPTARLTTATVPLRSDQPVDRLADAFVAQASPPPNLAWAALAGLVFGAAAAASTMLLVTRR